MSLFSATALPVPACYSWVVSYTSYLRPRWLQDNMGKVYAWGCIPFSNMCTTWLFKIVNCSVVRVLKRQLRFKKHTCCQISIESLRLFNIIPQNLHALQTLFEVQWGSKMPNCYHSTPAHNKWFQIDVRASASSKWRMLSIFCISLCYVWTHCLGVTHESGAGFTITCIMWVALSVQVITGM